MPKRFTLPGVLDVVVVDQPDHVAWLNAHPKITRSMSPTAGFVQRLLNQRMTSDMRFASGVLPVFRLRGSRERAHRQAELRARLEHQADNVTPEVWKLANYVAGIDAGADLGVTVQQWCGRLFFSDYSATTTIYEAGDLIARWPTLDPVRRLVYARGGRLEQAKRVLARAAQNDLHCVHATSIGMHNLVGSLQTMRKLAAQPRSAELNSGRRAVLLSLKTPAAVVRGCVDEVTAPFLSKPLTANTVIVFPVSRMFENSRDPDIAFMSTSWNACPARAAVLGLLTAVWEFSTGAPRVRRSQGQAAHSAHNGNGALTH